MALNFFNIRIRKARIHISITLSDFEQYAAIYRANSQTNQNIHFEYSSKITKSQGVAEFSAFSNFLFLPRHQNLWVNSGVGKSPSEWYSAT